MVANNYDLIVVECPRLFFTIFFFSQKIEIIKKIDNFLVTMMTFSNTFLKEFDRRVINTKHALPRQDNTSRYICF